MTAVSRRLFLGGASVAAGGVALIGEAHSVVAQTNRRSPVRRLSPSP